VSNIAAVSNVITNAKVDENDISEDLFQF
jgi:hypothetical protein